MFRMFGLSPDLLALHRGKVNENILKRYGGIDDFKWVIRKLRDTSMIGLGHELLAIENMMFLLQRTLQAKQPLTAAEKIKKAGFYKTRLSKYLG